MQKIFLLPRRFLLAISLLAFISSGCKSKRSDSDIRMDVEKALRADAGTSTVTADVTDGVATLSGNVADASAQSRAATLASGVKGVKSVQNNVTVAAPVVITPDDPLTTAVRDAVKDYPTVNATVNDGVVIVTGDINSNDWKKLKMSLDGLHPKRVDATNLKISK
jgi:hyperosmotically inducible periplasmic protein